MACPLETASGSLVYQSHLEAMTAQSAGPLAAIVNPAAGQGRAEQRWRRVQHELFCHGVEAETLRTAGRGDAVRLASRAVEEGFRTLLAVGGDGTVHEVVNGIYASGALGKVRLGVVPAGTGMDFARNTRVGRRLQATVGRILSGNERRVDLGLAGAYTPAVFVNFAESGIGAAVVAHEARRRPMPGRAAYLVAALDAIRAQRNVPAAVKVDGVDAFDGPVVSVVIANGRYFGGGMRIAPRASMDDGLLDVLILGDFSRGELLAQIWKIYPGVHLSHSKVAWLRGRSVELHLHGPSQLDLDGELYGEGPYRFSILAAALRLLA
jgi:YegS/Rv2252/BmrU family lipid kinase